MSLDSKIAAAKAKGDTKKVNQLKDLKQKALNRIAALDQEVFGPVAPAAVVVKNPNGGWQVVAGYGGGAGGLGAGYGFCWGENFVCLLDAAYYQGNSYSVVSANVGGQLFFSELFLGAGVGLASYSETVAEIPGVSGNISRGSNANVSLNFGRRFGDWKLQAGYGTAMGLTAGLARDF
jgi:hypothetical protein